jgi:hypothetical protein
MGKELTEAVNPSVGVAGAPPPRRVLGSETGSERDGPEDRGGW